MLPAFQMRLNKFISASGVCSRRQADSWIESGRVKVNGLVAVLGTQVEDGDDVLVDGKQLGQKRSPVYIALNKPVGITCTTERHVDGNIIDFVRHAERIFPVGRLDKPSEGLILLTNQGDIVNRLLRVENRHEKEYLVTVDRPITEKFLLGMAAGVFLPQLDARTLPCPVVRVQDRVFRIVLMQGLNRQIRRMCAVFGYDVRRLQRTRIGSLKLGSLRVGKWRDLTEKELSLLLPEPNSSS